jgi:hypothetical protein
MPANKRFERLAATALRLADEPQVVGVARRALGERIEFAPTQVTNYGNCSSAGVRVRRTIWAYRERLEALTDAAEHLCAGVLRLRTVQTGLHAVAELNGVDEERVYEEARDRGIEVAPLGMYFIGRRTANGLLLGFASTRPDALRRGMERLAASIEAARRPPQDQRGRAFIERES